MADVRCSRCGSSMVLSVQRPEGAMNEPQRQRFPRWVCPSATCLGAAP